MAEQIMAGDDPYWKAIDAAKDKIAAQAQEIAVLNATTEMFHQSQTRIESSINGLQIEIVRMKSDLNAELAALRSEVSEAKGGIALGKWIIATVTGLVSAGVLTITWINRG